MEQLLKITTIPLQLQFKCTPARLEVERGNVDLDVNRQRGGLHISSRPAELRLDSKRARNSVTPSPALSLSQFSQKGKQAAGEAAANAAKEGQTMVKSTESGSDTLNQIIAARSAQPVGDFTMNFIPTTGPDIQYVPENLNIQYDLDKLNFNWKISNGNLKFIPGDMNVEITQYPDVMIEYLGGPMYIPPRDDSTINVRA